MSIRAARTESSIRSPAAALCSAIRSPSVLERRGGVIPFCSAICYQSEPRFEVFDQGLVTMTKSRFLLLAAIVLAAVCFRIAPYVLGALDLTDVRQITGFFWNFSPVSALFLFCGAQFSDR